MQKSYTEKMHFWRNHKGIFKIQGCYVPQKSIFGHSGNRQLVWWLLMVKLDFGNDKTWEPGHYVIDNSAVLK